MRWCQVRLSKSRPLTANYLCMLDKRIRLRALCALVFCYRFLVQGHSATRTWQKRVALQPKSTLNAQSL